MSQALQSTHKAAVRNRDRCAAMSAVMLGILVCLASCWPCRRTGEGPTLTSSATCPADRHVGAHHSSAG